MIISMGTHFMPCLQQRVSIVLFHGWFIVCKSVWINNIVVGCDEQSDITIAIPVRHLLHIRPPYITIEFLYSPVIFLFCHIRGVFILWRREIVDKDAGRIDDRIHVHLIQCTDTSSKKTSPEIPFHGCPVIEYRSSFPGII